MSEPITNQLVADLILQKKLSLAGITALVTSLSSTSTSSSSKPSNPNSTLPPPQSQSASQKKFAYNPLAQRPFSLADKRFRHISLRLSYDGESYNGFSENVGDVTDNSVEKDLFEALVRCRLIEGRSGSGYSRCGRTDKGVSSFGQVIGINLRSAFPIDCGLDEGDLPSNSVDSRECKVEKKAKDLKRKEDHKAKNDSKKMLKREKMIRKDPSLTNEKGDDQANENNEEESEDAIEAAEPHEKQYELKSVHEMDYIKILNGVLPPPLRVISWTPVSQNFSARFSCTARVYRYFFIKRKLDVKGMREGLKLMIGEHDFRNFAKMDVEHVSNFKRTIISASIVEEQSINDELTPCYFEITGTAFLWHMVRNICSVLFLIGKGLEETSVITKLFDVDSMPCKPNYAMASDLPLVLHRCEFNDLKLTSTSHNLWELQRHLEERWERYAIKAQQIRNGILSMGLECEVFKSDVVRSAEGVRSGRVKRNAVAAKKAGYAEEEIENEGSDDSDEKDDANVAIDDLQKITWSSAIKIYTSKGQNVEIAKPPPHVPLVLRQGGYSYSEKISNLKGGKKERFEKNNEKSITAKKTGKEGDFHKLKQSEGGVKGK